MRAKDVYRKAKKNIHILADTIRKEGKPGHIEFPDKGLNINSAHSFEEDMNILDSQIAGSEIVGLHTVCQVKPTRKNDIMMTCVETEDNMAEKIEKCVKPIGLNILTEFSELAKEQEEVTIDLIKEVLAGKMDAIQANKEYRERLKHSLRDEKEITDYYKKYRDEHCGRVNKLLTKVETKNGRLIEIETKQTRPILL